MKQAICLCFGMAFEMVAKADGPEAKRIHKRNTYHLTVQQRAEQIQTDTLGKIRKVPGTQAEKSSGPHQRDDHDRPVDEFTSDGRREKTEKGGAEAFRLIETIGAAHEWKKQEKGQRNPGAFLLKASPSLCYSL